MSKGELLLGVAGSESTLSAFGRTFTIKDNEYARIEQTASCRLVKDIKEGSPKKEFQLDYNMIDGPDLEALLDLYLLRVELSLIVYVTDVAFDQYTVVMAPINRERILLLDNGLWSGVSVVLNEV
jgi:hypothetical protein